MEVMTRVFMEVIDEGLYGGDDEGLYGGDDEGLYGGD